MSPTPGDPGRARLLREARLKFPASPPVFCDPTAAQRVSPALRPDLGRRGNEADGSRGGTEQKAERAEREPGGRSRLGHLATHPTPAAGLGTWQEMV